MDKALTVGDIVWPLLAIGGGIVVLVVLGLILAAFADAFKH